MNLHALLVAGVLVGCAAEGSSNAPTPTHDGSVDTRSLSDDALLVDTAIEDAPVEVARDEGVDAIDAAESPGPHVCPSAATPKDCSKGAGTGEGDQCKDPPCCYLDMVQKVIGGLVSSKPEWFDSSGGCPVIKDVDTFMNAVVDGVAAQGYCVIRDPNAPGEEITVKRDNAFSENFDIVASTGCARWGPLICTGYCAPAWW